MPWINWPCSNRKIYIYPSAGEVSRKSEGDMDR